MEQKRIKGVLTGLASLIIGALMMAFGVFSVFWELYSRFTGEGGSPGGFMLAIGAFAAFFGWGFFSTGYDYLRGRAQ